MNINEAARILDLKVDELRPFAETDPFNNVEVRGYISRRQDHRYGAMVIYYADGNVDAQVIYGTPKFHYPFDKNGMFHFPAVERVEVHEKIDGTNILGFTYWTRPKGKSTPLVSYKTRLMPFVGDRGMGNFLTMWKRVLEKYPAAPFLVHSVGDWYDGAVSFEMFGSLNKHLLLYDVPLDARLLFKVDSKGIYPPREFDWSRTVPTAQKVASLGSTHDLYGFYRKHQAELGALLEETDEGFKGAEGYMWYALRSDDRLWEVFKCKPEQIQAIHFAAGGLNKASIVSACYRVLESEDLTVEAVSQMLLEDWGQEHIDLALDTGKLRRVVEEIQQAQAFKDTCLTAARELWDTGLSLKEDKGTFMRALSAKLSPTEMRKAYAVIASTEETR